MARALTILACLVLMAGCTSDGDGAPASGVATPTVAGGPTPTYTDYATAREAFTRRSDDGVLGATLEDAAWLRFEGDAETVQKAHRAYFDYGYTSFKIILRAKEYTRPTEEVFLLEDDGGARVQGKPVTFTGSMRLVDDRWQFTFDLSFQHAITKDTRWLRLTRVKDNATVEWSFR
ncbi:MAG: hypothetical protein QNJ90_03570 [Planctomycetota bacterium]|nr:hypothetical protein [Planctomycetota bacterium]